MIAIPFQHCVITATPNLITNVFSDGVVRHFYLSGVADDPEYHRIARWAGYGDDWHTYAIQHDAAHCLVAEYSGMKWCPVLHDPLPVPLDDAPQQHKDIEYLANSLQRAAKGQENYDPYNLLPKAVGNVDKCIEQFAKIVSSCYMLNMDMTKPSYHPLYSTWRAMKARCSNEKNKNYHNYGGRGITVCDRWLASFWNFLNDMGPRPSSSHSIDRINNNGNYEPSNCRWATLLEQGSNTRKCVRPTNGDHVSLMARKAGISIGAMQYRIARGYSEKDLYAPQDSVPTAKSGVKGVYRSRQNTHRIWEAKIMLRRPNGKRYGKHLGFFDTIEEAGKVYQEAEKMRAQGLL